MRDLVKSAARIFEDSNRPPLAGQQQFGEAIAIQIAENGAADQAKVGESFLVGRIVGELPVLIPQETRAYN